MPHRIAMLAAAALLATGCSKDEGPTPGHAFALLIVAGDNQTAVAGEELPEAVVVKVTDSAGVPMPGQIINFRVTAGGGSVFAGAASSDENGIARERWTMGTTAGPQKLEARAVEPRTGAAIVFASFTATAVAGAPASVSTVAGNDQAAQQLTTLGSPIQARVSDQFGNAVSGVTVTFVAPSGFGSASPETVTTGPDGTASASWTLGPALGAQRIEARVAGLTAATFVASAITGPLRARLSVLSGANQTGTVGAALAEPIAVQLADLDDLPIVGQVVTFVVTSGGGMVTESATTGADGKAQAIWTLGTTLTDQAVEVRSTDPISRLPVGPLTVNATTVADAPATIVANDTSPTSSHRVFPITARVLDRYSNPVTGTTVTFTPASGCGLVSPTSVATDSSGDATATWTHGLTVGTETVDAQVETLPPAAFHHAVIAAEVFDGTYAGTATELEVFLGTGDACTGAVSFTVVDGIIPPVPGMHCPGYALDPNTKNGSLLIADDGSFSGSAGALSRTYCSGVLRLDGTGVTASGTNEASHVGDYRCTGTWTATRQ